MKLVEILARELKVWPKGVNKLNQSIAGMIFYIDSAEQVVKLVRADIASDWRETAVTRADWEAERAKLKAPKADGDGWIRNRGRSDKCPVADGTIVMIKYRSGDICTCEASGMRWDHIGSGGDIMRYKIHKPAEQQNPVETKAAERKCEGRNCKMPTAENHSKECLLDAAIAQCWAGPLEWRDRIRELDTQRAEVESTYQRKISEITQERESLVQKLAGEGLALVEVVVHPVEYMSDWRNWKIGDLLEVVLRERGHGFDIGEVVRMKTLPRRGGGNITCEFTDGSDWWALHESELKWHSRPAR